MADIRDDDKRRDAEDLGLDPRGDRRASQAQPDEDAVRDADRSRDRTQTDDANPPHTTTGKITAPKFGSAGSGGLEYEGPLKKD